MPEYEDPVDAARRRQIPSGWKQEITPEQAAANGLQWTGGSTGWQPYVSPEQATAQNLSYTGGPARIPSPAYDTYGAMVAPGGGPVMPATPDNIARFGSPQFYSGPNAGAIAAQRDANAPFEALAAARQPIQERRQQLINQIPNMNRRQAAGATAELHGLAQDEHALQFEANQRRVMAHTNALESHRQLALDRNTEIDEQGHGMLQGMTRLDGMLRHGRISQEQYGDALIDLGAQFPLAMRHPEAAHHFEYAITEADKQNAYNLRREATQASKLGAKYGINPAIDEETGLPSVAATQRAALQTDKGRKEAMNLMGSEMQQKFGVPAGLGVSAFFNPIKPHEDADGGKSIKVPFIDPKTNAVSDVAIPKDTFEKVKSNFNDRYFALNPQPGGAVSNTGVQAAPAAPEVNPRVALAQRALDDPNASEAHKAAARKILGVK